MAKTIGFDLGVGSIGSAIRNTELSSQFPNQLEYFGADIFDSGVISDQESNAAHRSSIAELDDFMIHADENYGQPCIFFWIMVYAL